MNHGQKRASDLRAAWWTRLPNGDVRRVWVTRHGKAYHCQVKVMTPEQDAALQRLCGLEYALNTEGRHDENELVEDARQLAQIRISTLETTSAREALAFLGAANAAHQAIIEADPSSRDELA